MTCYYRLQSVRTHTDRDREVDQKENRFVNYSIKHHRHTLKSTLNNIRQYCNKPMKQKNKHIL